MYKFLKIIRVENTESSTKKWIRTYLSTFSAICIKGPKSCGKTWTSSYHCNSEIYLEEPSKNFKNRKSAEMEPSLILEGLTPRLLDCACKPCHYTSQMIPLAIYPCKMTGSISLKKSSNWSFTVVGSQALNCL